MSKIENITSVLCDHLMVEASSGDLAQIKRIILMLIEYSACEISRQHGVNAAKSLFQIAKDFEGNFDGLA